MKKKKIALIGAGSLFWGRKLVNDILASQVLNMCDIVLMAPHQFRLKNLEKWAKRAIEVNHLDTAIYSTTDRLEALTGADYVFLLYDHGGLPAYESDYLITKEYGIDVCVGDTLNPPGIMKALRNISVLKDISEDMKAVCPQAFFINYVNPMTVFVMAAELFGIKNIVGLCGGVESTKHTISECLEIPLQKMDFSFAGINHMCWALDISQQGKNLYPLFLERMLQPHWLAEEKIRVEMMQQFGYFVTETSGHLSDLLPWFRRNKYSRAQFCTAAGYGGASGAYYKYAKFIQKKLHDVDFLEFETGDLAPAEPNTGIKILEAFESDSNFTFYGNIMNRSGFIGNLPEEACVEGLLRCRDGDIQPVCKVSLPPQLAALNHSNILVHKLVLEAYRERNPELLMAAIAMDPFSQSVLNLSETRELTRSLLDVNTRYLSIFPKNKLRITINIPHNLPVTEKKSSQKGILDIVKQYDQSKKNAKS